jgi:hypothetical protein
LPIGGVISHVSRCGSTLVARWLGAAPDRLVLSEPAPLDAVLRLDTRMPRHEHVRLVRSVVAAMAQPRTGTEKRAFIKLDAWHTQHLPLIREAFPEAPVLGLAREPVEVLVSSERQRGGHMVPGALPPETFGMTWADLAVVAPADYMARVLLSVFAGMLAFPVDLHVDYSNLVAARKRILSMFGVDAAAEEEILDAITGQHAKAPELRFTDDRAQKQAAASVELREAATRIVSADYALFRRRAAADVGLA